MFTLTIHYLESVDGEKWKPTKYSEGNISVDAFGDHLQAVMNHLYWTHKTEGTFFWVMRVEYV